MSKILNVITICLMFSVNAVAGQSEVKGYVDRCLKMNSSGVFKAGKRVGLDQCKSKQMKWILTVSEESVCVESEHYNDLSRCLQTAYVKFNYAPTYTFSMVTMNH